MPIAKKTKSGKWSCVGRVDKSINPSGYKHFTADTKAGAERLANEAARGIVEKRQNMTVGEAIDQYIKDRENVLSPATVRGYKDIKATRFKILMDVRISDVNQTLVQRAVNAESKTCSPKTIRNAHGLLVSALTSVRPELVLKTKLPQKEKPKIVIPTKEKLKDMLASAKEDEDLYLAILICSQLGLRRSELCALKIADVSGSSVTIDKALVLNDLKEWVVKKPKSLSGYRTLPITKDVKEAIKSIKRSPGESLIRIDPALLTKRFERIQPGGIRLHDLRHYYASVMLSLNVPNKYAMELMGHATDNMLKTVYQHTMEEKKVEVAKTIEAYFDGVQQ
ncbi:MAG: site-specific integrase [Clostridia bacterium]|nr:site-specific integrase [Clostridia bacterium]